MSETFKETTPTLLKYHLPESWSVEERKRYLILSTEVIEALRSGKSVEIENAVLLGSFSLRTISVEGELSLKGTQITGPVDWSYATFKQVVILERVIFEKEVKCTGVTLEKDILLTEVNFQEEVNFARARTGGQAQFTETVFKQDTNFNSAQIEKNAWFDSVTFAGSADFIGARIGGQAVFTETRFKGEASFGRAQIEEDALFNPATFEAAANFASVRIRGQAQFTEAVFKQETNLRSARIERDAWFDSVAFQDDTDLSGVRIEGDTFLGAAVFSKKVIFENSLLKTVYFRQLENKKETQFSGAGIDLRGCIYDRIDPIEFWTELMKQVYLDRQTFSQLEETFRRAGREDLVKKVYYKFRRRESSERIHFSSRTLLAWLGDRFLWALTGYGVQLWQLFIASVVILLFGTAIFHLEGAVELKRDAHPLPVIQPQTTSSGSLSLPCSEAFWVSLRTFLPVVAIPAGAAWEPSSKPIEICTRWRLCNWHIRFVTFATLLTLAGWILVPVGVAGLTGILRR